MLLNYFCVSNAVARSLRHSIMIVRKGPIPMLDARIGRNLDCRRWSSAAGVAGDADTKRGRLPNVADGTDSSSH
jgi:hypothetical protein